MDLNGLHDLVTYGVDRSQRRQRVLEDHGHGLPAKSRQPLVAPPQQLVAM